MTDEQIEQIASEHTETCEYPSRFFLRSNTSARAIEAAATAPLLERIEKQQACIDQLVQEVAAGADAEAAQRERIAELEAEIAQRVPPDSVSKELIRLAGILRDCGRLISSTAENTLRTAASLLSAAPAAPEQQEPTLKEIDAVVRQAMWDSAEIVAQASNAPQADPPERVTAEMWQKLEETQGAFMQLSQRVDALSARFGLGAQQAEPVISTEHGPWVASNLHEGETYCKRCYLRSCFSGERVCAPHILYPTLPASGTSKDSK